MKGAKGLTFTHRAFSKFPSWWFSDFAQIVSGTRPIYGPLPPGVSQRAHVVAMSRGSAPTRIGISIAFCRLMIAVTCATARADDYELEASLSELADAIDMSKPMVREALNHAMSYGVLEVVKGKGRQRTKITIPFPHRKAGRKDGFFLVPHLLQSVVELPTRGRKALAAHKIYLTLLLGRDNKSFQTLMNHKTLRERTGIQPAEVRAGLTLLAIAGLIHASDESTHFVKGTFWSKDRVPYRLRYKANYD